MSIEMYTDGVIVVHMVLFLCLIVAGIAAMWRRIGKGKLKYWWLIPCSLYYSVFAVLGTFMASMAYDDPADPNFGRYGNWGLHNFILNDLARLIIWIVIGLLFYLAFEQKDCKKAIKVIGTLVMIILTAIISVLAIGFIWSFILVVF